MGKATNSVEENHYDEDDNMNEEEADENQEEAEATSEQEETEVSSPRAKRGGGKKAAAATPRAGPKSKTKRGRVAKARSTPKRKSGGKSGRKSATSTGGGKKSTRGRKPAGKKAKDEDDDKEWEVEKVLGVQYVGKSKEFLVRWKGWKGAPTWEPEDNLEGSPDLISEFVESLQ